MVDLNDSADLDFLQKQSIIFTLVDAEMETSVSKTPAQANAIKFSYIHAVVSDKTVALSFELEII